MAANTMTGNLALLIDGDNVSAKMIRGLMREVATLGTVSVRRIYGDFTTNLLKPWKEVLLQHSILPIQSYAYTYGKNSTDSAMIIDAMDLLYTGRFAGFCIVSSDSDFTRLAARIREQGVTGEYLHTPRRLPKSDCPKTTPKNDGSRTKGHGRRPRHDWPKRRLNDEYPKTKVQRRLPKDGCPKEMQGRSGRSSLTIV